MSYLGRPSAGDSPMAIGDRAMRDTASPQPPSQRNPTPRAMPGFNTMAAPSPYGAVSDEARRRYEERYAKKKAQEAEKAAQEARDQARELQGGGGGSGFRGPSPAGGMGPPQQQQGYRPPPQQLQQQQQQMQRPPQQQPQYQQGPPPPPQPQQQQYHPQQPQYQQQQQQQQRPAQPQHPSYQVIPGGYPQQQQNRLSQSSGHQSPSPSIHQQQHQQPQRLSVSPSIQHQPPPGQQQQQQQRWSNQPLSPGLGSWSQKAAPPPDQAWNRPTQTQSPPLAEQPEDHELRSLFSQFDSSRTGQLNSYDLQRLLAKDATMEAREDCVKMLMNIFDTDRSGSINFMEFEGLYRYIKDWHGIFLRFDRDDSGTIDRKELHAALLGFGFSLPPEMVKRLEKRFAPPPQPLGDGSLGKQKGISFDRFLLACVTVKHYTEAFRKADEAHQGRVTLDYNQFMDMVLESPS